ncbi:MAG: HigA family addiction module antitoxin [Thermodesulfobacteriota bacterium]
MDTKVAPPIHPGEILLEEFMKPLGIDPNQLARDLKVAPRRITDILDRRRGIAIDTALRLSTYFGTSVEFWMNLQTHYEVEVAEDSKLVEKIHREVRPRLTAGSTGQ